MTLKRFVSEFFTNWREYEGGVAKKVALTLKNRTIATGHLLTKGRSCCGNYGEPGC